MTGGEAVTMDPRLAEMRAAWETKAGLRKLYGDYYARMIAALRPGALLEIGGGFGNLKRFAPHTVSMDILAAPELDLLGDAQALPFSDGSFDSIAMVDVLHHIERPTAFFREAVRVLRPGGRVALLEPGITPLSWLFFHYLHPEPVFMGADPLAEPSPAEDRDPFDANQAIPTLLFGRHADRFRAAFPELAIVECRRLSLLAYPLTGGYRPWSLIPASLVRPLLAVERAALPLLGPLMAFRLLVVLERR